MNIFVATEENKKTEENSIVFTEAHLETFREQMFFPMKYMRYHHFGEYRDMYLGWKIYLQYMSLGCKSYLEYPNSFENVVKKEIEKECFLVGVRLVLNDNHGTQGVFLERTEFPLEISSSSAEINDVLKWVKKIIDEVVASSN
jgi:hypothetical protein